MVTVCSCESETLAVGKAEQITGREKKQIYDGVTNLQTILQKHRSSTSF
jgi:hypothetical protein